MRITDIASCVLTVPTREPMARNYPQQKLVVAEIATDEGVRGLGYSLVFGGGGAEAVHAYLEARLKLLLLGEDPLYVERLWEKMFRADMGIRKQGAAGYALAALTAKQRRLVRRQRQDHQQQQRPRLLRPRFLRTGARSAAA